MIRRRGRGIVGTMATTAVVAGTATAVSRNVNARHDQRTQADQAQMDQAAQAAQAEAQLQNAQAQEYQSATHSPAANSGGDVTAQLEKLAQMKNAGTLSQQEYEAAKRKLLM